MRTLRALRLSGWTSLLVVGLAWVGLALPGCADPGFTAGLNPVPEIEEGPTEYRTEMETIPDAQMVRENTMPRWQLGRYAFKRGPNRLIVLAHFTAFGTENPDTKKVDFTDWGMERVWITIPDGTPVGKELDVNDLEYHHLVGYDFGELHGKDAGQFVEPFRIDGHVAVLEIKKNSAMVYFDIAVNPKDRLKWGIKGVYEVPQTTTGINATPVAPGPEQVYAMEKGVASVAPILPAAPAPTSPPPSTTPPATQPSPKAATQPATTQSASADIQPPGFDVKKLYGRWVWRGKAVEFCFQFDPDGTAWWTWGRGFETLKCVGKYKVEGNYIAIGILRCFWAQALTPEPCNAKAMIFAVKWDKDTPILQGDVVYGTSVMKNLTMPLSRGVYPDMRYFGWAGMDGKYSIDTYKTPIQP